MRSMSRFAWLGALIVLCIAAHLGCMRSASMRVGHAEAAPAPTMSRPLEYEERPISVEAGAHYFLTTGGGDPYATGMAYPLFLALMEAYPDELGRDWNEFAAKFGFIPDPERHGDPSALPVGFHLTTDPNTGVPWLVGNCQMCHAERIRLPKGDLVVPGLGNKAVRPHAYQNALARIGADPALDARHMADIADRRARASGIPWNHGAAIVEATFDAWRPRMRAAKASWARFDAALPGRMATIESFALALHARSNAPIPMPAAIGWAKVPDVRSFPFRETFSYDGSGFGSPQALVLEADFLFGARDDWYREHPHIATSMYLYLRAFTRTLPYPAPIDRELVAHGKQVFDATCAGCHGHYVEHGSEMRVSYKERVIPQPALGTDAARIDAVTPAFVEAANAYALVRGHTRVRNTGGYVPPVLLDVWARGVFGHAGQWPSLEALATPPEERPRRFIVDTTGLYDLERVGVRYEVEPLGGRPLRAGEYLYDGGTPGLGVEGHAFLSKLPRADRRAVLEYLKTL
jgi:hypothetical protein